MELNDIVQVTLTAAGAKVLNKANKRFNKMAPAVSLKTDYREGEIITAQLWSILDTFGKYAGIGSDLVFTNLEKAD